MQKQNKKEKLKKKLKKVRDTLHGVGDEGEETDLREYYVRNEGRDAHFVARLTNQLRSKVS